MNDSSPSATELMEFPCEFPLKVFVLNQPSLEQEVLDLIRPHCPADTEFKVTSRLSRAGKYRSLTIIFTAYSRAQMDDIYQTLSQSKQVVMSL